MARLNNAFEIHLHGQVPLRADVSFDQVQDALKPIWKYAGARSLTEAATSVYEDEPGIRFDANDHLLQLCWTVAGDEDFRQALDEMCMSLNEISQTGATIEVTFYDTDCDEDDDEDDVENENEHSSSSTGNNIDQTKRINQHARQQQQHWSQLEQNQQASSLKYVSFDV